MHVSWHGLPSNALRELSPVVSKHQPLEPAGFAEMVTVSEDLLTRSYLHSMHRQQVELAVAAMYAMYFLYGIPGIRLSVR